MKTPLLVVNFKTKECRRYIGRACTDIFNVETEITAEKIEAMRSSPDTTGERAAPEPEAA